MERLMRYLLSNSNMAGSAVASVICGAFVAGLIADHWLLLTAVGYGTGFLALYRPGPATLPDGLNSADTLTWLADKALPRLNGEAQLVLKNILDVAQEVMPRLKAMEAEGIVQAENRAKLKQLLNRYLPDALEGYFKLPALYAKTARVANGQTAYQALVVQLRMLDAHVKELRDGVYSDNVNALLANGQFLKEKFDKSFTLAR